MWTYQSSTGDFVVSYVVSRDQFTSMIKVKEFEQNIWMSNYLAVNFGILSLLDCCYFSIIHVIVYSIGWT